MYTSEILIEVRKDIDYWIENFVEESNEFYDYKFPPCPYARSARLKNESTVHVYDGSSSVRQFIKDKVNWLINHDQYFVHLMVFPTRVAYYPGIHRFIKNLNKEIIPQDYFGLGGFAPGTTCKYPGLLNNKNYFVIGTNKLSKVLPAVEVLKSKGYYKDWSNKHYKSIVTTREQMHEQFRNK